eukprot:351991-Chlamydomonas_euryale.AAC.2
MNMRSHAHALALPCTCILVHEPLHGHAPRLPPFFQRHRFALEPPFRVTYIIHSAPYGVSFGRRRLRRRVSGAAQRCGGDDRLMCVQAAAFGAAHLLTTRGVGTVRKLLRRPCQ